MRLFVYAFLIFATACATTSREPARENSLALKGYEKTSAERRASDWNRRLVSENDFPFSTIGQLRRSEDGGVCTATLISPCHILTARHCLGVIHPVNNKYQFQALAGRSEYQGQKDERAFQASARVIALKMQHVKTNVYSGVRTIPEKTWDWAVLRLDQNLGRQLGWMRLAPENPEVLDDLSFAGYASKIDYRVLATTLTPLRAETRVREDDETDENHPYYKVDLRNSTGDSGGPLWRMEGRAPMIYGVHSGAGMFVPSQEILRSVESSLSQCSAEIPAVK